MTSDVLAKLKKLLGGQQPVDTDGADAKVDATVLGELLNETYANTGRSTEGVSQRLLKSIKEFGATHGGGAPKDGAAAAGSASNNANSANNANNANSTNNATNANNANSTNNATNANGEQREATVRMFAAFLESRLHRLRDIFARLDKDHDKVISLQDVYDYLDEHALRYDRDKIEVVYNAVDRDRDGAITYDEFVRQLLLVPNYGREPHERFFYRAYDFFTEDLEISADSDVVLSKDIHNGLGYFYAGGLAGVISRTCTAPFDRLKVYLIANSTHHAPLTFREAIIAIYTRGNPTGLRAFFTGNGLNIIKVLPESAMKFGGFEFSKRVLAHLEGVDDPAELSRVSTFLAGGIGGMLSQFCVYPIDTLKFRVQCAAQSGGPGRSSVLYTTFTGMLRDGGLRSFYRGLYVGVLGVFPFAALDLGIFSAFKSAYIRSEAKRRRVSESDVQLGTLAVLSMGAVSGSVGASVVYPVNLVRTRIQTQGTSAHPFTYNGFWDCYRQSVKREGWRGLFRGLGPNLAKVAPSVSISYLVYEKTKRVMGLP